MKNLLLIILIIISYFCVSAQKHLIINNLSRKDDLFLLNYVNNRLINSENQDHNKFIELNFENSDSLVILKRGYIPIVLINLDSLAENEIEIKLPKLERYVAIDTLYENIVKRKWYSSKEHVKSNVYTPNNWTKIDSFPTRTHIILNSRNYLGELKTKKELSIIDADGKRISISNLRIGTLAIYVIQINE
jgi:hypothetical protein